MKADADGVKHCAVKKVGKLKKGTKQASITGFLMTQREPLGEIGNNLMDSIKEEKNSVNDAPRKENMKVGKVIEKKQVEEAEDPGMVGLCEYEKIRLRNIRQREALFAELALQVLHSISKTFFSVQILSSEMVPQSHRKQRKRQERPQELLHQEYLVKGLHQGEKRWKRWRKIQQSQ